MRAALVVLALMLLPACGASLHTHANAAAVARDLIDASGAAIQAEWKNDLEEIHSSGVNVAARETTLVETFAPIQVAYDAAVAALEQYMQAIRRAEAAQATTLDGPAPRSLYSALGHLADLGEAIGVKIPRPPVLLEELAK